MSPVWRCVLACSLATQVACAGDQEGADSRIRRMLEDWSSAANEIVFYGKVVDQNGSPVSGAVVSANAPTPIGYLQDRARKCLVHSDAAGRIEVTRESFGLDVLKGSFLFIDSIEKDGYEYEPGTNPETCFSYRQGYTDRHTPAPMSPVVFRMRKLSGDLAFLVQEQYLEMRVDSRDSGRVSGCDFVQRGPIMDVANPTGDEAAWVCDLQLKATFNTNNARWVALLSPGNTNGGIIVSDQLLYEAPEAGYQPEYAFTPEDRKPVKAKYVYLKSREPAIYTRFEIEHINANPDFFRLSGKSVTNPYGERNLEQATDLPYEVTRQLTDDARTAFREGRRPEKPDLLKVVNEAKEKANKER